MKKTTKKKTAKKRSSGAGTLALLAGGIVALAGGVALAKGVAGKDSGSNDDTGSGSGSGSGDTPWKPGPGNKGRVYGGGGGSDPTGDLPADFRWDGMDLWISPQCDAVLMGERFYQDWQDPSAEFTAAQPPDWPGYERGREYEATRQAEDDNSIYGFVDYYTEGVSSSDGSWPPGDLPQAPPKFEAWLDQHLKKAGLPRVHRLTLRLAAELLRQVSPKCLDDVPYDQWGPGLVAWLEEWCLEIDMYVDAYAPGIVVDFDPELQEVIGE